MPVACADGIAFTDGTETFGAGRVVSVEVRAPFERLSVQLDGQPLMHEYVDGRLVLLAPDLPPGAYTLQVTADERQFSRRFTLTETVLPGGLTPRAYLDASVERTTAALDRQLETADAETATVLRAIKNALLAEQAASADLSDVEIRGQAQLIAANELLDLLEVDTAPAFTRAGVDLAACQADARAYPIEFIATITAGVGTVTAVYTQQWIAAGIGAGVFYVALTSAKDRVASITEHCFGPFDPVRLLSLNDPTVLTAAALPRARDAAGLTFNHGVSRGFLPEQPERVDGMIGDDLTGYIGRVDRLYTSLASIARRLITLPADGGAISTLRGYAPERDAAVPPGELSLTDISDARISGTLSVEGGAVRLLFAFKEGQMPDAPVTFRFGLRRAGSGRPADSYEASLNPADRPVATPSAFAVGRYQTYEGYLQGAFADRFEIDQPPRFGTVTLLDPVTGLFRYRSTGPGSVDRDEFTFVAVNAYGRSEPALVEVEVRNDACEYLISHDGGAPLYMYRCVTYSESGIVETTEGLAVHGDAITISYETSKYDAQGELSEDSRIVRELGPDQEPRHEEVYLSLHSYVTDPRLSAAQRRYHRLNIAGYHSPEYSLMVRVGPVADVNVWYSVTERECSRNGRTEKTSQARIRLNDDGMPYQEYSDSLTVRDLDASECPTRAEILATGPEENWRKLDDYQDWYVWQRYQNNH
mgnify:FL=1